MGALGCSDGPLPSSVVCAKALIESAPASATSRTTALAKSLFFIVNLVLTPAISRSENVNLCEILQSNFHAKYEAPGSKVTLLFSARKT
jgi:preprotein translocase subunit SecG